MEETIGEDVEVPIVVVVAHRDACGVRKPGFVEPGNAECGSEHSRAARDLREAHRIHDCLRILPRQREPSAEREHRVAGWSAGWSAQLYETRVIDPRGFEKRLAIRSALYLDVS